MAYEEYMRQIVTPMRTELTSNGFEEFLTPEDVDDFFQNINEDEITFVVINSVCGCAAGLARPAAVKAIEASSKKPTYLKTAFAGQDKEATARLREYLAPNPPSSPSMALWRGNQLVHFIPRERIEGNSIEAVTREIEFAFENI